MSRMGIGEVGKYYFRFFGFWFGLTLSFLESWAALSDLLSVLILVPCSPSLGKDSFLPWERRQPKAIWSRGRNYHLRILPPRSLLLLLSFTSFTFNFLSPLSRSISRSPHLLLYYCKISCHQDPSIWIVVVNDFYYVV